ncbi:MAG: hypothetical protein OEZ47_17095, partial [Gammaproteobacteria bacterium]|nr:hypothetical protein [Gammaproteobacteria bacterium]
LYYMLDTSSNASASSVNIEFKEYVDTSLPLSTNLAASSTILYRVGGLTPSTGYTLLLSGLTGDIDMSVSVDGVTNVCGPIKTGLDTETCTVTTSGNGQLFIRLSTVAGGDFVLGVTSNNFTSASVTAPATNYVFTTQRLAIGESRADYYLTGLAPSTSYLISVNNVSTDVEFIVYSDAFSSVSCSADFASPARDYCWVTTNPKGEVFISVGNVNLGTSASFDLRAEIPAIQPIVISGALDIEQAVTVASGKQMYYRITSLGALEKEVSLAQMTGNMDLHVYDNPFWVNPILNGRTVQTNLINEYVHSFANEGNELYVRAANQSLALANSTLLVRNAPSTVNVDAIVTPAFLPAETVGVSQRKYDVSITAAQGYFVFMQNPSDQLTMTVDSNVAGSLNSCAAAKYNATDRYCYLSDDDGLVRATVDAAQITGLTATYDFKVVDFPDGMTDLSYVAAGKEASGLDVPAGTTSFYRVTGLIAGASYTVNVLGVDDATLGLEVYKQPLVVAAPNDCVSGLAFNSEVCVVNANEGGELFLTLDASTATTLNTVDIDIELNAPASIVASPLPYTSPGGSIARMSGQFFQVTGIVIGPTYSVRLSGLGDTPFSELVDLYVFNSPYQGLFCHQTGGVTCSVTPINGEFWIYLDASAASGVLTDYELHIE